MPKAVVLLSGGLDSTTALAVARGRGFELYALSVDYGQRHRVELERAAAVAKALGVTTGEVTRPISIALAEGDTTLAFARRQFNEAVQHYNHAVGQFPTWVIAGMFGFRAASTL